MILYMETYFGIGIGIETRKEVSIDPDVDMDKLEKEFLQQGQEDIISFLQEHSDVIVVKEGLMLTLPFVRISLV